MGILLVSSPVTTGTRLSAPAKPNTIVTGPLSLSAPAAAGVGRFEAIIYTVAMVDLRGGDRRSLPSPRPAWPLGVPSECFFGYPGGPGTGPGRPISRRGAADRWDPPRNPRPAGGPGSGASACCWGS